MNLIKPQKIVLIMISVIIFSIYLISFFFLYERKAEKHILENDLQDIITDLSEDLKTIIIPKSELSNLIKEMKKPDSSLEDENVENKNRELFKISIIMLLIVVLICGLIIFYNRKKGLDIKNLIITNILVLIFVGLAEAWFFTNVAGKFLAVDPNVVKLNIVENIKNFNK